MHGNARSSPLGRLGMVLRVKEGEPVARGVGVSRQCVSKWVRRYREEGRAGLEDRSSRPRCSPMSSTKVPVSGGPRWPPKNLICDRLERICACLYLNICYKTFFENLPWRLYIKSLG